MTFGAVVVRPDVRAHEPAGGWQSCVALSGRRRDRRRQRADRVEGQDHRLHRHPRHAVRGVRARADPGQRQADRRSSTPCCSKLSSGGIGIFGYSFIIAAIVAVIAHVVVLPHPVRHARAGHRRVRRGRHGHGRAARRGSRWPSTSSRAPWPGLAAILLVSRVGAAEPAANTAFLLNSVAAVVLGGVSLVGGRGSDRRSRPRGTAAHRADQRADPARRVRVLPTAVGRHRRGVGRPALTRFQK